MNVLRLRFEHWGTGTWMFSLGNIAESDWVSNKVRPRLEASHIKYSLHSSIKKGIKNVSFYLPWPSWLLWYLQRKHTFFLGLYVMAAFVRLGWWNDIFAGRTCKYHLISQGSRACVKTDWKFSQGNGYQWKRDSHWNSASKFFIW